MSIELYWCFMPKVSVGFSGYCSSVDFSCIVNYSSSCLSFSFCKKVWVWLWFVFKGSVFSVRFYLLSLLFLLMDMEVVLLVLSPVIMPSSIFLVMKFSWVLWMFVLGTVWEWWVGGIDWAF
uniref:NADH-ubiquinone oxidoreductase chain 3 n=1 Tax=Pallisentis celatus TaxID=935648 RepID=V5IXB9_PALCE|nr:NADH dehydrogenase subunit 3 [Pallisentis celatus]AFK50135.1 NADH dehydrogenase subunit 3 [Pallisentis celatus]